MKPFSKNALRLRWARFFTLIGWEWKLFPRSGFDFLVTFPCGHSECGGSHTLLVAVSRHHEERKSTYYQTYDNAYAEPHPALFGDGPVDTFWVMVHGHGGGEESLLRVGGVDELWKRAAHG